jgi:hypothetical protein
VALGGRWRTSFSTRLTSDTFGTIGCLFETNFREPRTGEVRRIPSRRSSPQPGTRGPGTAPSGNRKAGPLWEGEGSESTRLDDESDCSIDEAPSTYAKWPIFVCQVATFAGVAEGQSTGPLQEDGGRARPGDSESPAGTEGEAPAGLWTTESNILAIKRLV